MNSQNLILAAEHLVGFVIVILALAVLWGLTALIGRVLARPETAAPAAKARENTDDDVVVIAAAVAAMLDARHRVVSIRPQSSLWGVQGRQELHASHRIR